LRFMVSTIHFLSSKYPSAVTHLTSVVSMNAG
jgi:hypothetical protein